MKIAIILGSFSLPQSRALDFWFNNIWESSRGMTGTELSYCVISRELAKLGHDIYMFTTHAQPDNKPNIWEGCKLYNLIERHTVIDNTFDCVISINEPDMLRGVCDKPLRIVWQFLNDFSYCLDGFDDFVDLYFGVCEKHTEYLKKQTKTPEKWGTLSLGCYPEWYEDKRVPGRVVWCSSADRGLHWLLSQWPKIKNAVPEATLRIFYHFNYGSISQIEPNDKNNHPHVVELAQRIRYCKETIERLKSLGVEHIGSVSREQMRKELNEASVFAFPCSTVAMSEGFSLSTLENHASFTSVVMTDQDCLGSIYKDSGCIMINGPVGEKLSEFSDAVIKCLTDKDFANNIVEKCRKFSENYAWQKITKKMEDIIIENL